MVGIGPGKAGTGRVHAHPARRSPEVMGMSAHSPLAEVAFQGSRPAAWLVLVITAAAFQCIVNESERCDAWSIALARPYASGQSASEAIAMWRPTCVIGRPGEYTLRYRYV
jgi:hypothetical protein